MACTTSVGAVMSARDGASVEVDDAVDLAPDVGLRGRLSLQAPKPTHERRIVRIRWAKLIHRVLRVTAPGRDHPFELLCELFEPPE